MHVHNSHLGLMFKFFTVRFFKEFFWCFYLVKNFYLVFTWCFKYIRVALFFKMRSKLAFALGGYAFWVLRLWFRLRLGRKRASSKQAASSAAAFGGLAASSLFLVWKRKNRMGER